MARRSVGKKSRLQTALRIREENLKSYNISLAKLGTEKPKTKEEKEEHEFLVKDTNRKLEIAQKEVEVIKTRISAA